jgi:hypothetical protein
MTGALKIEIKHPLSFESFLHLAAARFRRMLHAKKDFSIGVQIPRGAPFSEVPPMIPNHPRWGLYLHLDGVDDSLVEAYLSTLSSSSAQEPVVLCIAERRTPASKALAASLAIAGAELLGQDILDHELVWSDKEKVSPCELEQRLTVAEPQLGLESALDIFTQKMNRVT